MGPMMHDVFSVVYSVVAVVGASVAALMYSDRKVLRESNQDLRARDTDRDRIVAEQAAEIASLRSKVEALTSIVTGETYLVQILDASNLHHTTAMEVWKANAETDAEILRLLKAIQGRLAA